jgi:hypothetical protein
VQSATRDLDGVFLQSAACARDYSRKFTRESRSDSDSAQRLLALIRDAATIDGFCERGLVLKHLFKGFQLSQSLKCLVDAGVEPLVQGDFFEVSSRTSPALTALNSWLSNCRITTSLCATSISNIFDFTASIQLFHL